MGSLWTGLAEVRKCAGTAKYLASHGAFVRVVGWASGPADFARACGEAFGPLGLCAVDFVEVQPWAEFADAGPVTDTFQQLAAAANAFRDVRYGDFNWFPIEVDGSLPEPE